MKNGNETNVCFVYEAFVTAINNYLFHLDYTKIDSFIFLYNMFLSSYIITLNIIFFIENS